MFFRPPSTISALLGSRCPFAIGWLVISVVINSFDRMRRAGFFPHVVDKVFERLQPPFAHTYSATSVIAISSVFWIATSLLQLNPGVVFSGLFPESCKSMCGASSSYTLISKASARTREPSQKTAAIYDATISALANAFPIRAFVLAMANVRDHSQSAKNFSSQVFEPPVTWLRVRLSHEMLLSLEGNLWLEPASGDTLVRLASFYKSINSAATPPAAIGGVV